ncbi:MULTISPECIES: hypothetical protein [Synechococcales]|uniref:hypothetical protein n=1 Tax=unclassified Synechococcus TaxID=2626047 RepID=UPI000DB86B44|nr:MULTISPECIES: hypothetical protein [unclassified Synechococcus]MCT0232675.1 hypothetical protein [Synechococcus sp. CS-1327]PZV00847.1 MAG: hypothetical protein DCF24_06015 [Cyanobium sp.]
MLLVLGIVVVLSVASIGVAADVPREPTGVLDSRGQSILRYVIYLSVPIGGALGGFIYSISRNRGFIVPHWVQQPKEDNENQDIGSTVATDLAYTKFDLGTVADLLVGIGGGIIIFNLVPQGQEDLFEGLLNYKASLGTAVSVVMKIMALSLIGGFAGISLFDEAAKRINRQLQETQSELLVNRGKIQQLQQNDQQESDIQYLLNPLVDPSIGPLSDTQKDALESSILKAPLNIRNKVFERLQKAYDSNSITGTGAAALTEAEIQTRMTLQEGLLAGFKDLITASEEQKSSGKGEDAFLHRYRAHQGFVHIHLGAGSERIEGKNGNASRHWRQAEESLTLAIQLRDLSAADKEMYWHYSLQRMVARYKLDNTEPIQAEINQPEVKKWLNKDPGILHAILTSLPADFGAFLRGLLPALFEGEEATPLPPPDPSTIRKSWRDP